MNVAIKNFVNNVKIPFESAVDCATINPAKTLGVDDVMGSIKVGKRANFAILDKDFNVLMTIRDGNILYKNF